ncbi:unnamed protein product [Musa acuminata subsp. malaccensis]|uniref:(wild Malaysian banana) hypothetical protein n=1 Tax=Musa acuminata subsp. malaccensis TaxID=214687 RepID=A0A804IUC1_MUSAM|nr:unnamed protein product [Musa acuminata subsp. malaccensis]
MGGEIGFGSSSFRSINASPFASIRWRGSEERLMLDPGTPATLSRNVFHPTLLAQHQPC